MTPAQIKVVEKAVNDMIDGFSTTYPDDCIEAWEVMVDFAQTAIDARKEETEDPRDNAEDVGEDEK